jgi:glycolate oxidase iron-sulfur subunit
VNDKGVRARLLETADQCVKCGLCLPHCPTYRVRRNESASPRGRIALIQGLTEGNLRPSRRLWAHLASCLECRACEVVCPSLLAFGSLMDDARALQNQRSSPWRRRAKQAWLWILSSRKGAAAVTLLSRAYRASGLGSLVESSHLPLGSPLRAYHRVVMQLGGPQPTLGDHAGDRTPAISLFLGCVARTAQPGLSRAACRVCARLGLGVLVPEDQRCCGAIHRHNGFPFEADRLLERNAFAFADQQLVVTASACAAELRAHPDLRGSMEICRFLTDLKWPRDARLRPLRARVAVHEPCSHRNLLRDVDAAYRLLKRIPKIELLPLEENAFCCGAAGTYLLENPIISNTLVTPKIDCLRRLQADILVTTNTGCALHLTAGAREAGLGLEVLHPVELIERQLP